nr:hypothetical protein [Tanacetum cinerariifolium]
MSTLRGRKSVPGISSSERENGKKGTTPSSRTYGMANRLLYQEGRNVHTKRTEIRTGMNSSERENGKSVLLRLY